MLKDIKEYVKFEKAELKKKIDGYANKPALLIVQTGDNEASNRYVRNKVKDCVEVGISADILKMSDFKDDGVDELKLRKLMQNYNGVIFQLPSAIPHIEKMIPNEKDVDGFVNKDIVPCTARGVIDYLAYCGMEDFRGCNILIINRSEIVGRPLAKEFLDRNGTVTIAHSKTAKLKEHIEKADIIVTAVGIPNFIKSEMIRNDQIVIDVGISFDAEGRIVGDCERGMGKNVTPVPGGVGLLTRVALLKNIVDLVDMKRKKEEEEFNYWEK